ncbi:5-(carboxyamino)imidazole ribonucleotide synthase [Halostella sp. JP-L12]|uniref:5-(carboxyamino)imidazole ribonucleotide synthase n=1 Tax=Halostella TaxID=1843185 RepID=UPI000EF80D45|nr:MULTISPECIES: 5-(carboxyamino)imidazole ribonucleotide synthase [Halostella]NHN49526.1 5-(carboxyamino)imidazole ribonucleotide synthase [Halostella sp. JP-L12]
MTSPLSTPGPTLGVVGGGQLGRMMAEAAAPLGVELVVLDPTPDCPASPVARDQIVGDFDDPDAVRELADRADFLTFEIELTDPDLLETVGEEAGVPVHPSPDTLRTIQDKLVQKRELAEAGIPVPAFRRADDADDLRDALDDLGAPAMVKARTGGYDGRGNAPVEDPDEAEAVLDAVGAGEGGAMVEELVDFEREVSVIGVKGDDEVATFPVGENVHEEEILRETVVPARTSDAVRERAEAVARDVLEFLDGRGVYGIELFEASEPGDGEGEILVNEIAPRPHNSGHWTIEGALTSQFEQHVRAVTGRPLGATELRATTAMANILGDVRESKDSRAHQNPSDSEDVDERQTAELHGVDEALATPAVGFHWYGKREVYPLRKMGHVTAVEDGGDPDELLAKARDVRDGLTFDS